ncbi:MAG: ATP-binding protein, partial [Planctomycetota bacterium]
MLRAISQAVDRLDLRGRCVLVAVSGGIDSVALLHALHELAHEHTLKLLIGHVNHGLRGAESEADQAAVERLGAQLGLPVEMARVDVRAAREGRSS